jgi:NAD(P)-dependent dehydrogenase (short-subunit alcohol dehydrogenase family)
MELKGTTAIITGSSGRLGGAIAKALATAGCNCICHYNGNKQKAEELVEQIKKLGVKALAVEADLVEPEQIEDLFEKVLEFGTPQVLINSAAVFSRQSLMDVTFEEAQKVLSLNLIAPILMSRAFAKIIDANFGKAESVIGKIINIADVGGIRPWAGSVLYCSSKAGLIGATKALAKELAPRICVNSIAPGVVTWPSDFDESEKKRQLSFVPVKRIAEPSEVTEAIIFLLRNDYITGQVLNVDGGRCI